MWPSTAKEIVLDVDFPGANFLLLTFAQHAPAENLLDNELIVTIVTALDLFRQPINLLENVVPDDFSVVRGVCGCVSGIPLQWSLSCSRDASSFPMQFWEHHGCHHFLEPIESSQLIFLHATLSVKTTGLAAS
jgi:hypothetical protein